MAAAAASEDDEWVYLDGAVGKGDEGGGVVVLALTDDVASEEGKEDEEAYLSDYSDEGRLEKAYESDEDLEEVCEEKAADDGSGSNSDGKPNHNDHSGEARLETDGDQKDIIKAAADSDHKDIIKEAAGGDHKKNPEETADGGGGVDACPVEAAAGATATTNEHYDGGVADLTTTLPTGYYDKCGYDYDFDFDYGCVAHLDDYAYGSGAGYNYGYGADGGGYYGHGGCGCGCCYGVGGGRGNRGAEADQKDNGEKTSDDGAVVIDECPAEEAERGSSLGDDHHINYEFDGEFDSVAHLDDYAYGSGAGYNYGYGADGGGYYGHGGCGCGCCNGVGGGRGNRGAEADQKDNGEKTSDDGAVVIDECPAEEAERGSSLGDDHHINYEFDGEFDSVAHLDDYAYGSGAGYNYGYGAGGGGYYGHGYGYGAGAVGYYGLGYAVYGEHGGYGYGAANRYYAGAGLLPEPIRRYRPSYAPGVGAYPLLPYVGLSTWYTALPGYAPPPYVSVPGMYYCENEFVYGR